MNSHEHMVARGTAPWGPGTWGHGGMGPPLRNAPVQLTQANSTAWDGPENGT